MTNDELCRSIASVIANYRNGEFGDYDEAHLVSSLKCDTFYRCASIYSVGVLYPSLLRGRVF
ncbi:hypothetical protein, partial [Vibrio vulnificus]|uniref:hypothetical protein n=1 Tax=Vibrio vulnificus TaxID=672 RepID=UPI0019D48C6D